jgi:regulator of protease activity HflC (stomatin/prohibitin superfamily)
VRQLLLALVLVAGCKNTSSTEVGVRTCLLGIFEKRGTQQTYSPGGTYVVMPIVNAWTTLPLAQQNLLMNASPKEGDRPIPDDITFKTKDGNNIHIDVNLMWRIDQNKAGDIISRLGDDIDEIEERIVRPMAHAVIRDVFNEITSEEYYQVAVKNRVADKARDEVAKALSPHGILVDMLQVQQHRFDVGYQAAINAQKQAEADVQTLIEQQKNVEVEKHTELEGKRALWNQRLEEAQGEAGKKKNEADGYYQTKTNDAKAVVATAQAEAEGIKKEAEALSKLGGDAYVKMQVSKIISQKKFLLVPNSNVSTMDVNKMVRFLAAQNSGGKSSDNDDSK